MNVTIIWDLEEDEEGNIAHIAEHGMVFGDTIDGRYIVVIYEQIDEDTVYPVTAFEVPEPR